MVKIINIKIIFFNMDFFLRALRTVGHLKVTLLLLQTAAFIGATLCGIIDLHGLTPCVY